MNVTFMHYLILSALLFMIGAAGFIIKKNAISVFLCLELMMNAANLSIAAFAKHLHQAVEGQIFIFLVMVVAAAEAAVGLAITLVLFRTRGTISVDEADAMKG